MPPLPADVTVTATLFPNSDPAAAVTIGYSGNATVAGIFGAAQGLMPLNFTVPGEYSAKVFAKYVDSHGTLLGQHDAPRGRRVRPSRQPGGARQEGGHRQRQTGGPRRYPDRRLHRRFGGGAPPAHQLPIQ